MKKILIMILLTGTLLGVNSEYKSIILSDNEGNIIYEENGNYIHPLASITKLMSAVITFEAVEKGQVSLEDMIPISKDAALRGGSRIELYWGSRVKLRDLLEASLIHSANNATYAIAEYICGDYERFVDKMNEKADELGMVNTKFYTPAGLPTSMTGKNMDKGTARDIVRLSLYALKNKELKKIVAKKRTVINNSKENLIIYNRNKFLKKIEGVNGLKTGHHEEAGYNISVSFNYNNNDYVAIIFGSPSEKIRDKNMKYLLEEVYTNGLAKLKEENAQNTLAKNTKEIRDKSIKIDKKDDVIVVETEGIIAEGTIGNKLVEFEIEKEDLKELIESELLNRGKDESTLVRTEELLDENGQVIEKEIIYTTGNKGEIEELEEKLEEKQIEFVIDKDKIIEEEIIKEDENDKDLEGKGNVNTNKEIKVTTDSALDIIVDEILEDGEVEVRVISENLKKNPIEEKFQEAPVVIISDYINVGDNKRIFVNEDVKVKILD